MGYHGQVGYYNQNSMYQNPYAAPQGAPYYTGGYYQGGMQQPNLSSQSAAPGGMFTRNLIGSLSASAFRLTDPDNKIGVWFILQDLSVRTEGTFRYDFSLGSFSLRLIQLTSQTFTALR
jgi:Velvet factor